MVRLRRIKRRRSAIILRWTRTWSSNTGASISALLEKNCNEPSIKLGIQPPRFTKNWGKPKTARALSAPSSLAGSRAMPKLLPLHISAARSVDLTGCEAPIRGGQLHHKSKPTRPPAPAARTRSGCRIFAVFPAMRPKNCCPTFWRGKR